MNSFSAAAIEKVMAGQTRPRSGKLLYGVADLDSGEEIHTVYWEININDNELMLWGDYLGGHVLEFIGQPFDNAYKLADLVDIYDAIEKLENRLGVDTDLDNFVVLVAKSPGLAVNYSCTILYLDKKGFNIYLVYAKDYSEVALPIEHVQSLIIPNNKGVTAPEAEISHNIERILEILARKEIGLALFNEVSTRLFDDKINNELWLLDPDFVDIVAESFNSLPEEYRENYLEM